LQHRQKNQHCHQGRHRDPAKQPIFDISFHYEHKNFKSAATLAADQ
jgi:hypothetical protein